MSTLVILQYLYNIVYQIIQIKTITKKTIDKSDKKKKTNKKNNYASVTTVLEPRNENNGFGDMHFQINLRMDKCIPLSNKTKQRAGHL